MIPLVGVAYFSVYFLLFRWMIRRFDFKTPGREDDGETKLYRRADYEKKRQGFGEPVHVGAGAATVSAAVGAEMAADTAVRSVSELILNGLGGNDNIELLDCCATRLRVTVKDADKVDEGLLRQSGAAGVIKRGNGVQVVYGPQVSVIKSELELYIDELTK